MNDIFICDSCGKECKPIEDTFSYTGTHCTHGRSGTEKTGDILSDCCHEEAVLKEDWDQRVDMRTCEVTDIIPQDYPDFCDAHISFAEKNNGEPLDEDELEKLNDECGDWINQYCLENWR